MNIRNIRLTLDNFTSGGGAILNSVVPDYEYDNDRNRTGKILGLKVSVVFPANAYDTLTVKVSDPTDRLTALLEKARPGSPVYVDFEGFTASIYNMRGDDGRWKVGVAAKATGVNVLPTPDTLDFGPEIE